MSLGNLHVVGPEKDRAARQPEMATQFGIGFDAQKFFDVALGKFHLGAKSRPLDPRSSSTLSRPSRIVSGMLDTMAKRLTAALSERGMKAMDLKRATGLSKAAVYFLLDGTTQADKVRDATVQAVCDALRINREWLLRGKGPMDSTRIGMLPPADAASPLDEVRLAQALMAQALAESIPTAGRALVDALVALPDELGDRPYLRGLLGTIRAELARQDLLRAPKRQAQGSAPRKR